MKVVQINTVCDFASTGVATTELAVAIREHGHQCRIAYSIATDALNGDYQIGRYFGKKVHAIGSRIFGLQAYHSRFATKRFLKYLENEKPDIVHLGNLHSNFMHLKLLLNFLKEKDIATVITLHDCWFFTGKCTHYKNKKCYRWETGCGHCPKLHENIPSYVFDRSHKMWNDKKRWLNDIPRLTVVGVSEWVTSEARRSFLKDRNIVCIYNWVDRSVFKFRLTKNLRKRLELENKYIILGVANGWSDNKGFSAFIRLAGLLSDKFRILLVGNVPTSEELPGNIVCLPQTNDMELLAQYYSMADVFVNTSLEETFGKVTAESLACGTPAIVFNTTACPELIGENCGYVVETGDMDAVYEKIKEVVKKGKQAYKESCIAFANEKFDYQTNTEKYIQVYQELLERRKS